MSTTGGSRHGQGASQEAMSGRTEPKNWTGQVLGHWSLALLGEPIRMSEEELREAEEGYEQKRGLFKKKKKKDPFQKLSKPPFHKAWQRYSIEPG